jgi:competence protein ComEC
MLASAAALALGILSTHWIWNPPLIPLLAAFIGAALTLLAAYRAPRVIIFPLLLLWLSVGQFRALTAPVHPRSRLLLQLADGLKRSVAGTVSAVHPVRVETRILREGATETEQTQQIDVVLDHVEDFTADRDWQAAVQGGLRLTVYAHAGEELPKVKCGERLRMDLRFRVPEMYRDPGAWDYPAYLAQHGIAVLGSADAVGVARTAGSKRPTLGCMATAAQTWASGRLKQIATASTSLQWLPQWLQLTPTDTGILSAMLFGDRTRLRHSMRTAFERTGSFHLLVVSGLHISIVIGLIFWFFRKLRFSPWTATGIALLLAIPYAFLTGFAPPVQRALWLSAVYLISRRLYRERAALNAIGIAAIVVLIHDPSALFGASLQMTFLAVLVIAGVAAPWVEATVAPYLRGMRLPQQRSLDAHLPPRVAQLRVALRMLASSLRPWLGPRWSARIPFGVVRWTLGSTEALMVALVVETAMVLPMAVYFHRITLAALPANIIGLPILAFLLPVALATFLLGCIHPALALPTASLTALLLHAISGLIHLFGSLAVSGWRTPDPPLWALGCFAAVWIAALWGMRKTKRWRRATLAGILAGSLLVLWPAPLVRHKGTLEVTALDVGQGDSLLIVTPDGDTLLVDAGGPIGGPHSEDSSFDIGEDVVSPYLWTRHIRRLDAVALTHAHSDHMGGMPAILRNFHPKALWVGHNPKTPEYRALLKLARQEDIPVKRMSAGERFSFGGMHVRILAPASDYEPGVRASNDDSLVMRIRYGNTAALLEGDAEAPIEEQMVATEPLSAGLLKVGHHGSNTSTIPAFLAAVHPRYAVISVGRRNPFGHPRTPVFEELQSAHVRTYRTDTLGLSTFLLNGTAIHPAH